MTLTLTILENKYHSFCIPCSSFCFKTWAVQIICFQRSTKRSFTFTSLTFGAAVPSAICLTGTGAGKRQLEKKNSSKLFKSCHNTLNNCIALFVISTEKFCSECWSISHSNLQDLLQNFWHNQPQQGRFQEQFLPKILPKFHQQLWRKFLQGLCW